MTDRLDELQRLHDAETKPSPFGAPFASDDLNNAMRNALPALLRVARAAQKVIGGDTFTADDLRTHFPDAYELHAALAELRGTT